MSVKIKENNVIKPLAGNANIEKAVTVDSSLNSSSQNAVQNKAVKAALDAITVGTANTIDTNTMLPNSTSVVPKNEANGIANTVTALKNEASSLNNKYINTANGTADNIKLAFDSNYFSSTEDGVVKPYYSRNTTGLLRGSNSEEDFILRDATVNDNLFWTVLNDNEVIWADDMGEHSPDNTSSRWYHNPNGKGPVIVLKSQNNKHTFTGSYFKDGDEITVYVRTSNYAFQAKAEYYTGMSVADPRHYLYFDINGVRYKTSFIIPYCNYKWKDNFISGAYKPKYNMFGVCAPGSNNKWYIPMWMSHRFPTSSQELDSSYFNFYRDALPTGADSTVSYSGMPPYYDVFQTVSETEYVVPCPLFTRYNLLHFIWSEADKEFKPKQSKELMGQYLLFGNGIYMNNTSEDTPLYFGWDVPPTNGYRAYNGTADTTSNNAKCIGLGYLNVYSDNTAEYCYNIPLYYRGKQSVDDTSSNRLGFPMFSNSTLTTPGYIHMYSPIYAPKYEKNGTTWTVKNDSIRGMRCSYGMLSTSATESQYYNNISSNNLAFTSLQVKPYTLNYGLSYNGTVEWGKNL